MRRNWKYRRRKQQFKSKLRRRRRRDIFSLTFLVKFLDPRFLGQRVKKRKKFKPKSFFKGSKEEKKKEL